MKLRIMVSALFFLTSVGFGQTYVGRVDTIGGTTYDWWANANVHRWLVNSPQFGVHAAWMYSAEMSNTTFPDRNMRYSFYYGHPISQWNWVDPDPMQSGVNVFTQRAGYGVIDADSAGRASIVANTSSGLTLARDEGPGYGIFEYSDSSLAGYSWPDLAIGDDGTDHIAMCPSDNVLSYVRFTEQGWDSIRPLNSGAYPAYSTAASKTSPSFCVAWVDSGHAYYVLSENRGDTLSGRIELDPPPAFGGDTVTRFSLFGMFAFFDSHWRLHIVAAVYPEVHDTAYVNPAEIWHWCPANQPHWSEIHRAGCESGNQQAPLGYNAIYADRPSIGEGTYGLLYVAWEQFDSSNVEPQTNLLRAGVWVSRSTDNGVSWMSGELVTDRSTASHRFPCMIDRLVAGDNHDTMCVLYLEDGVAGFFIYGQGPATPNPVICQFIPTPPFMATETPNDEARPSNRGPSILSGSMVQSLKSKVVFDAMGRRVANHGPGVYFVREQSASSSQYSGRLAAGGQPSAVTVRKVVVQR